MDDALDVWSGGVDGGVKHEAGLVHPEVGAPLLHSLTLIIDRNKGCRKISTKKVSIN